MDRSAPPYVEPSLALRLGLAGASNCVSAVATNPLDVLKTRLQLQRDVVGAAQRVGLLATARMMVMREGVISLYAGLVPSLAREASYSAMRLGLYEPAKTLVMGLAGVGDGDGGGGGASESYVTKLTAGALSGCTGAAIANPTDLVKVRLQAVPGGGRVRDVVRQVWRNDGIAGFWRGVEPNVQRAAILTAAQVGTYDHAKAELKRVVGAPWFAEGLRLHIAAATIAGLAAAVATCPVDTAKTRMMAATSAGTYRSMWHCITTTVRQEGPWAVYKGFIPTFTRIACHTVITFAVYERLRRLAGVRPV